MSEPIVMPKLGMDMSEGTLINWLKNVGDQINTGDVIAEIETDKTTIEVESTVSGMILSLDVKPGDVVAVGSVMGYVGQSGESVAGANGKPEAAPVKEAAVPESEPAPAAAAFVASSPQPIMSQPEPTDNGNLPGGIKASPIARNIAAKKGIDLRQVRGSGPGGRITKADVERFVPVPPAVEAPAITPEAFGVIKGLQAAAFYPEIPAPSPDVEIIDTSNLRKRIAARMLESKQHVPHFYVTVEVDVEALLALRKQLNATVTDEDQKITINDLIVKATALTLRQFPNLNSHFYGDKMVRHKRIHIGMAVALPQGGLINVVAKDADKTALGTMAAQNKAMIARAREGKVKPDDVQGSTFTVSNLGAYEVEHFSAIINPPEAGILAVGSAQKVPVVQEDGGIVARTRMKVTVSVDHRVSDGAEGAAFLKSLKELLENPLRLVI